MELIDGYDDLSTSGDYLWMPRISQTVLVSANKTRDVVFAPKFKNPIVAILADTTNINPSNIAGYFTQVANTQLGIAEIGERFRLPNKTLRVFLLPELFNYQAKFTFAFPVGNCKVSIWEAVPRDG